MIDIRFTKMHGIGNDFIIINQIQNKYNLDSTSVVKRLSSKSPIWYWL